MELPIETQVACVGESTAAKASDAGFNPDFFPTEPGSEVFLEEFEDMVSNTQDKPRVLIVQAEKGRVKIQEGLNLFSESKKIFADAEKEALAVIKEQVV